jgi:hypothetical protein
MNVKKRGRYKKDTKKRCQHKRHLREEKVRSV